MKNKQHQQKGEKIQQQKNRIKYSHQKSEKRNKKFKRNEQQIK